MGAPGMTCQIPPAQGGGEATMSAQQSPLWQIQPHTQAKHYMLRYYLSAWFAIQSKEPKRLLYVDGFAGPGRYQGGEPGSPLIALEAALDPKLSSRLQRRGMELIFYFIEEDPARYRNLLSELNTLTVPSNFKVHPEHGAFENSMARVLDELDQQRKPLAPSFVFIDPFGVTGYAMHLVERIAKHPRSEVHQFQLSSAKPVVLARRI